MQQLHRFLLLLAFVLGLGTVASAQAPALQRITVYIQNPTSTTLNMNYRKGGDDWVKYQIRAGYTLTMTGIAPHRIRFDNGRGRQVEYTLPAGSTNYFNWSQGALNLLHR